MAPSTSSKESKGNKGTGMKPDKFDPAVLGDEYAFVAELINSNPEIRGIYKEASDGGWFDSPAGVAKFKQRIQGSDWWQKNNKYARKAWTQFQLSRQGTGSDYQLSMEDARIAVKNEATALGAKVTPEKLDEYAKRYVWEGWGDGNRISLLRETLANDIGEQESVSGGGGMQMRGAAGNFEEVLRRTAVDNGLNYSDSFYTSAAQSVAKGLSTEEDWTRDIQEQAATLFPVYADKIRAGMTARDLASPYIQIWSDTFDQDRTQVDINNADIRAALGGFDDKGNPVAMNLWDFQKSLRDKPEWMNTRQAQNQVSSIASDVLKIFGMRG